MIRVAGTGHRPDKLGGYSQHAHWRLTSFAMEEIAILHYTYPIDSIISGMALGWDQALAEAAVELGIPLIAALPFADQCVKWPEESRKQWERLVSRAAQVHEVCPAGYAPWKMQRRNEWMVDQLEQVDDVLLALWDGTPGGTGNCVDYALRKGFVDDFPYLKSPEDRILYNLYDRWVKY